VTVDSIIKLIVIFVSGTKSNKSATAMTTL